MSAVALNLVPGAILRSGRETITIVSVDACVEALVAEPWSRVDRKWIWPRRSTERVLASLGFAPAGHEDPAVLAERVKLALATYRSRRAAA